MRGNAEEGGLGEQRTLLIGGPKHGQFMNLAAGQEQYEFTSMATLGDWPSDATHLYSRDKALERGLRHGFNGPAISVFSHQVLQDQYHGGFILQAATEARKGIDEATDAMVRAQDAAKLYKKRLDDKQQIVNDRNREIAELSSRLQSVRMLIEQLGMVTSAAVLATGIDYDPIWKKRDS